MNMRAWGPLEQRRSAGERGGGWRLRLVAVADSGAADRSVGSDSARAAVPGSLAGLPRFFRSVAHGGRGCNPGPRAWGARRGRAVACARGVVAWRAACGCAATTYRGLRPGGYCASGACSTRRVASIALVVVCGRRPYFARRRRHVRQQDSPRVFPDPHAMEGAARCIHVLGVSVARGRRPRRRRRGWLVCAAE